MGFTKVNVLVLLLLSVNLALARTILEAPSFRENVEAVAAVVKDSRESLKTSTSLGKYFILFLNFFIFAATK